MKLIQKSHALIRAELESAPALKRFGTGWISGVLGLSLGLGALGLVLALRFPGIFSAAELTPMQGKSWFRMILMGLLLIAFLSSLLSLILRESKTLGTTGLIITLLASALGGCLATPVIGDYTPLYLGLDFFVLNVLFTGLLFIPLETIFPKHAKQALFRAEWREDIFYYLISSMLVQVITWLSFGPARTLFAMTNWGHFRDWVASLPLIIQVIAIMFLTDLVQYWVHRAFHRVPMLWRFHAVHHSAQSMDWMAGARMHFLEILALRGTTVFPMMLLGFHQTAVGIYIFLVYLWSTFIHANIGWRLKWMEKVLVTPRFHHWHHGIEKEAIDVNFSIHFPLIDRLFGTHHMPEERWPEGYGIGGHPVPQGYLQQLLHPFLRK
ncbi:MAG: sterol desaturase family protein [Verrucomicrobia bacterium]|nr:sterol desaturase family protein [Verrucomicrobiota bacterium]